jgi:dihydrofolate reductase
MILSIIAAIGKNNALGKENKLLWQMPADMKHFKELTTGHTVIMGRKTHESIGRPLPNRENIVITRDTNYAPEGVTVVHSLDEALKIASLEQGKKFEENQDEVEVFVIGGGQIYTEAMEKAHKLYITEIDNSPEADTFFPEIKKDEWKETSRESHEADDKNPLPYSFVIYTRKA